MPPKKKTTNRKGAGQKAVVPRTNKRVKVPQKKKQRNKDHAMDEAKTVSLEHESRSGSTKLKR